MNILDFIGLVGATLIFTWSKLFTRVRAIYPTFLECSMCVGFWVGVAGYEARDQRSLYDAFLTGCSISLLSYTTTLLFRRLQAK